MAFFLNLVCEQMSELTGRRMKWFTKNKEINF